MQLLLGDHYPAFLATYDDPPATALRANTLKCNPADLVSRLPFELRPLPWSDDAWLLADDSRPGKHPYHAAGLYYLQDPSSLAPAELLRPQPGEIILDLAAAPGGKATHIAARMRGEGLLVANEVVQKRAWELAGNLERWGATNVAITTETPARLAERWPGFFDAVLVDAPCSGEGMFRKSEAARLAWTPSLVAGCAARQDGILEHAARLVRPGGRLVYATCTFAPEEDEGTVARFLRQHPDFSLVPPATRSSVFNPGPTKLAQSSVFSPGRPDWLPRELRHPDLANCVRLWPHTGPGEGHFAVLLQKDPLMRGPLVKGSLVKGSLPDDLLATDAAAPAPRTASPARTAGQRSWHNLQPLPRPARALLDAFLRDVLTPAGLDSLPVGAARHDSHDLALVGSYVYALPPGLGPAGAGHADLAGLRFLHPGWWLGEIKRDRFEPSHALALALHSARAAPHAQSWANDVGATLGQPSWRNLGPTKLAQPPVAALVRRVADFAPGDPRLRAYLRGETVADPGEDGWTLVTVDGFGIGWAKRVGGRLKSHYPKGLRWTT